jgi:RND superfamily putative drug exporter
LTSPAWDVPKKSGEKLINAAEDSSGGGLEIKLGGDPIYQAQGSTSPEGLGFLGAAIVLLIAFGSVVAAGLPLAIALIGLGITSGGLILLLANVVDVPDWTTAVSGPDRHRCRDRLRVACPDPVPRGDARWQGPPRRRGRGGHDSRP